LPAEPASPELLAVRWEAKAAGLWLAPDEYRKLEINIVRMRSYEAALREYIVLIRRTQNGTGTRREN